VAITPTSESAPGREPAALIDGDQISIVERREGDPKVVALVPAGRKGERAEYRCAACGYGIVVYGRPPGCPMCSEGRWEHVEWRPSSRPLDDLGLAVGSQGERRRLHSPSSLTADEPIRSLRPGQAGASLEQ
jgi:hypothetical protein